MCSIGPAPRQPPRMLLGGHGIGHSDRERQSEASIGYQCESLRGTAQAPIEMPSLTTTYKDFHRKYRSTVEYVLGESKEQKSGTVLDASRQSMHLSFPSVSDRRECSDFQELEGQSLTDRN